MTILTMYTGHYAIVSQSKQPCRGIEKLKNNNILTTRKMAYQMEGSHKPKKNEVMQGRKGRRKYSMEDRTKVLGSRNRWQTKTIEPHPKNSEQGVRSKKPTPFTAWPRQIAGSQIKINYREQVILSIITYCAVVWEHTAKVYRNSMQVQENLYPKSILQPLGYTRTQVLFDDLNYPRITYRMKLRMIMHLHGSYWKRRITAKNFIKMTK